MSIQRMLCFLAVLLLPIVMTGSRAVAQESDALRFFQQNPSRLFFRGDSQPRRAERRVRAPAIERERFPSASRRRIVPDTDQSIAAVPERPAVPVTTFVHVVGDSLAELLAQGLKEQLGETKPEIGVAKRTRSSSGLVRDDYHDWNKALRELLSGTEKVDLIAVMLGSNDRQSLRDETASHEFRSDRWRELYARRIDDLIVLVREKRVPLVVVGMPVMQGQKLSADMLYINDILRERASRGGAGYADIWEAFATEQGQYGANGPDVNGEIVKLRTADGIHFTKAGARKLGFFAAKAIEPQLGRDMPAVEVAALPSDLSEQIRRDAPGLVPQSMQNVVTLPAELPAVPVIGERPLAGPTTELTRAPVSAGGTILSARLLQPANEMTILVEQALAYGRLPPAKPGRADDFRWPAEGAN